MSVIPFIRPDEPEWRLYLSTSAAQERLSMTQALRERLEAVRGLYPAGARSENEELTAHVQRFAAQRPANSREERWALVRGLFTASGISVPGSTSQVLTADLGLEHHSAVTNALCQAHPDAFLGSALLQDPVALEVACQALELPFPKRPLLSTALETWQHYVNVCSALQHFRLTHELSLDELRLLLVDYPAERGCTP